MPKEVQSQSSDSQHQFNQPGDKQIAQLSKVPKYMAFNQHITYGYRLNFKNPFQIIQSLFIFHNQTINIWSHLLGAFFVFGSIIWFFTMIDKAELEYQLKNYESNLNQGFDSLNNILHKIQTTLSTFQNSQNANNIDENLARFQYQLRAQYKLIKDQVKYEINSINQVLTIDVELTDQQRQLRKKIQTELFLFEDIEKKFQTDIQIILWSNFNDKIYDKAHQIQQARKKIQTFSSNINRLVIEYLQLEKSTPNPYGVPRWPVIVFLCTATICLGCSATFHLFYPMSSKAFKYFRRFDYVGVIINIVGTGIPPIYYALYCKPIIATIYLTVMIVFGTILFVILLQNWIHKSKNKKYKPILFGIFGLTYLIPYSHFMLSEIFFDNFGDSFKFSHSNFWWVTSSSLYLFGLYIFIKKWPQSKYKQQFDFIGNSHQIWHFLCLCGVAATYLAININYQTRKHCPCP